MSEQTSRDYHLAAPRHANGGWRTSMVPGATTAAQGTLPATPHDHDAQDTRPCRVHIFVAGRFEGW